MADETVVFVINPVGWVAAFKSPAGIVGRDIEKRTEKVRLKALLEVPAPGNIPRNRTMKNYATGALAGGIKSSMGKWHAPRSSGPGQDIEGRVTSTGKHTMFVIKGTRPHVIRPRIPSGFLRFRGRTGAMVITRIVHHPGTVANDFLSRSIGAAI